MSEWKIEIDDEEWYEDLPGCVYAILRNGGASISGWVPDKLASDLKRIIESHSALVEALTTISCGDYENSHNGKAAAKIANAALALAKPKE